jgi:hypothetical protein
LELGEVRFLPYAQVTNNKDKGVIQVAKRNAVKNRKKRNSEKGLSKGNSKYAMKKALQRKGVYSPRSPLCPK